MSCVLAEEHELAKLKAGSLLSVPVTELGVWVFGLGRRGEDSAVKVEDSLKPFVLKVAEVDEGIYANA